VELVVGHGDVGWSGTPYFTGVGYKEQELNDCTMQSTELRNKKKLPSSELVGSQFGLG